MPKQTPPGFRFDCFANLPITDHDQEKDIDVQMEARLCRIPRGSALKISAMWEIDWKPSWSETCTLSKRVASSSRSRTSSRLWLCYSFRPWRDRQNAQQCAKAKCLGRTVCFCIFDEAPERLFGSRKFASGMSAPFLNTSAWPSAATAGADLHRVVRHFPSPLQSIEGCPRRCPLCGTASCRHVPQAHSLK